jgi:hypothetical protein
MPRIERWMAVFMTPHLPAVSALVCDPIITMYGPTACKAYTAFTVIDSRSIWEKPVRP